MKNCTVDFKITGDSEKMLCIVEALEQLSENCKHGVTLLNLINHLRIDDSQLLSMDVDIEFVDYCEDSNVLYVITHASYEDSQQLILVINQLYGCLFDIYWMLCSMEYKKYQKHDRGGDNFFPEECCVCSLSNNGLFEEFYGETFNTADDAIDYWCECVGYERNNKSIEAMVNIVEHFQYSGNSTFFSIGVFEIV